MAVIPETQRRRLASSVVGTAGVDRSGEILAQGVGAVAQDIQRAGISGLREQRREERRLRLQTESDNRAQNKKVTDAQEKVEADKASINYNSALGALRREGLSSEEYDVRQKELLDKSLEDKSSTVQSLITGRVRELTQRSSDKNLKSDTDRKMNQIKQDLDDSLRFTEGSIDATFSDPATNFGDKLNSFDDDVELYTAVLQQQRARGILTDTQFRAASEGSALKLGRVAVNSIMENQPEKLDQFLALNGDIFTNQQQQELRKEAKEFTDRRLAEAKQDRDLRQFDTSTKIANRILAGEDVSLNEIDQAVLNDEMTESEARAARRVVKSSKAVFAGDKSSTFADLQTELSEIVFEDVDKDDPPLLEEDQVFPFEKVARFRQRTLEALEKGEISNSTAQKLLKRVTPIFNEDTGKILDRLNTHVISSGWISDTTREILTEGELADANLFMQRELMSRIDEAENKSGPISLSQVKDIVDKVKDDWKLRVNSNTSLRTLGEVFTTSQGKVKVVGFDTDGEPLVDFDLAAQILLPFAQKSK